MPPVARACPPVTQSHCRLAWFGAPGSLRFYRKRLQGCAKGVRSATVTAIARVLPSERFDDKAETGLADPL